MSPALRPAASSRPHTSSRIVILTGAGISKESGLSTFRDPDGVWAKYDLEEVATPEGFERNPRLVHQFYNARRRQLLSSDVQPNPAHLALADLERHRKAETLVVTQNIDDLHERAGTRSLIHMHGELLKARCARSGRTFPCHNDLSVDSRCECCGEAGTLRPHVVWFGEMPLEMDRIHAALERCALFIAVGTSGQVYPAAGFVEVALRAGARAVEINAEPTSVSPLFHERRTGPASTLVPAFVQEILHRRF